MGMQSPMMRRVRECGLDGKLSLPRKGRIRFVLVLIVVGLGFKLSGALFEQEKEVSLHSEAIVEPPNVIVSNSKTETEPVQALSFGDVFSMMKQVGLNEYPDKTPAFYNGDSLLVYFSIDSMLQNYGKKLLRRYHPKYGAIAALNPETGRVLSLISYERDSVPHMGNNLYGKSIFPAASIYKTITAAAAIEHAKFTSKSNVKHAGRRHTLYKFQLVKNLKNYVNTSLGEAFAYSVNPVFARIAMYSLGNSVMKNYGSKFGFNATVPFELQIENANLLSTDSTFSLAELASGFNQKTTISPLFGALIASAISENGRMPRPRLVDSVMSVSDGRSLFKGNGDTWRVPVKESTSRELRKLMSGVTRYGTARKSFRYLRNSKRFDTIQYGGKTGSVDKDGMGRVDWFVGFARHPKLVSQKIALGVVTVHGAYWTVHSSYIAAEMFRVYLKAAQEKQNELEKEISVVLK